MNLKYLTLYENLNFTEFVYEKNSSSLEGEFLFLYDKAKLKLYKAKKMEEQCDYVLSKGDYLFEQKNYPVQSFYALMGALSKDPEILTHIFKKSEASFKEEALWEGKETYGPMMLRVLIEEEHEAFQLFWAVREKELWM